MASVGAPGQDASVTPEGGAGMGKHAGRGGADGRAGCGRHVSTLTTRAEMAAIFAHFPKVKLTLGANDGFFPGGGSGVLERAPGAARFLDEAAPNAGSPGVARGGFGGGGCGEWQPEEVELRGEGLRAVVHCRTGSPTVTGLSIVQTGREAGAALPPQAVLCEGGQLTLDTMALHSAEGNGVVVKATPLPRQATRRMIAENPRGRLRMLPGCEVVGCGGNGLLVLEGGTAELRNCRVEGMAKDGLDVKGEGTLLRAEGCQVTGSLGRNVTVSKRGAAELTGCLLLKSKGAGAACSGAGARLQLTGCQVRESAKAGVFVTDGAQAELRKCAVEQNHDVGVMAQGLEDKETNDAETVCRVVHCMVRGNGYGVWSQDKAGLTIIGGAVTGSVNEDVTQQSAPDLKGLRGLVTGGAQLRLFFGTWHQMARTSRALASKLGGLEGDELAAEIERVFCAIDADGSGSIGAEELGDALDLLGLKMSEVAAREMLFAIDNNSDGAVDRHEFKLFIFSKLAADKKVPVASLVGASGDDGSDVGQGSDAGAMAPRASAEPERATLVRGGAAPLSALARTLLALGAAEEIARNGSSGQRERGLDGDDREPGGGDGERAQLLAEGQALLVECRALPHVLFSRGAPQSSASSPSSRPSSPASTASASTLAASVAPQRRGAGSVGSASVGSRPLTSDAQFEFGAAPGSSAATSRPDTGTGTAPGSSRPATRGDGTGAVGVAGAAAAAASAELQGVAERERKRGEGAGDGWAGVRGSEARAESALGKALEAAQDGDAVLLSRCRHVLEAPLRWARGRLLVRPEQFLGSAASSKSTCELDAAGGGVGDGEDGALGANAEAALAQCEAELAQCEAELAAAREESFLSLHRKSWWERDAAASAARGWAPACEVEAPGEVQVHVAAGGALELHALVLGHSHPPPPRAGAGGGGSDASQVEGEGGGGGEGERQGAAGGGAAGAREQRPGWSAGGGWSAAHLRGGIGAPAATAGGAAGAWSGAQEGAGAEAWRPCVWVAGGQLALLYCKVFGLGGGCVEAADGGEARLDRCLLSCASEAAVGAAATEGVTTPAASRAAHTRRWRAPRASRRAPRS